MNIDFNTYYGYNGWSITPKMRTGDAYLQTKRDAYKYVYDATDQQMDNNRGTLAIAGR